jgi:MFS family permease
LNLLDGGRQQIFFSFGLWVLVDRFGVTVPVISALLIGVKLSAMLTGRRFGALIDTYGEKQVLAVVNFAYIIALAGYAFVSSVYVAAACYAIYSFISPFSTVSSATYLRKVAVSREIAPSLAMGVSLQHAAAIVVPVTTGFILNFVGYQVPFLIACGFACITIYVTRRLDPATQKSPARIAEERAQAAAAANADVSPAAPAFGK